METGGDNHSLPEDSLQTPPTPTTPKTPLLEPPQASSSPRLDPPKSPVTTLAPTAAISSSIGGMMGPGPSLGAGHFMYPPGMYMPQIPQIPLPAATGQPVSIETLSNQIFSLSQCVMGLSQKVSDNHRLFEENLRLKDIVIDLEFKLKDANERVKSIDTLRDAMTSQFAQLNKSLQARTMRSVSEGPQTRQTHYSSEEGYDNLLNVTGASEPIQSDLLIPEKGESL